MAKRKLVDGVLCRDAVAPARIVFFPGVRRADVYLSPGCQIWCRRHGAKLGYPLSFWNLAGWKAARYDLPAPRKGRACEVKIEL